MAGRGSKYHAKRTQCGGGHTHPSKAEAKRCDELRLLERAGQIHRLEYEPQYWFSINGVQVKHENGRRVGYKPDWRYFQGDRQIVEECKGFRTADYVLRLAIFKALFPYVTHRVTGK
jgi:hypothetical protein